VATGVIIEDIIYGFTLFISVFKVKFSRSTFIHPSSK